MTPCRTVGDETSNAPVVLVAEDEEGVRVMLGIALRAAGFDSVVCPDGEDALRELEGGLAPALVLLVIRRPRMGGVWLAKRVRAARRVDLIPIPAWSESSDKPQE